eukprot:gb/GECG01007909.1/.p1 GENE.gb/GECG01007909.1/~~gb/GECG01007909.1/.p1  ORF type:complete len:557 (+),score=129.14 gb/GECG01007909.1/:1-1671(+)
MGDSEEPPTPLPLVLTPEDCADGLYEIKRTLDGNGYAYCKLVLSERQLTSLGDGSKPHDTKRGNALEQFKHIQYLDLSKNYLQDFRAIASMPSLLAVNLSKNDIVTVCDLSECQHLQVLNLNENSLKSFKVGPPPPGPPSPEQLEHYRKLAKKEARQRTQQKQAPLDEKEILKEVIQREEEKIKQKEEEKAAEDPEHQQALERWKRLVDPETGFKAPSLLHLIVNHNFLTSLEGLDGLPSLMRFEAAANRLTSTSTIASNESLPKLRELILPANPITDLSGLHSFANLQVLNLDKCKISSLRPLITGRPDPKKKESTKEEGEEEENAEGEEAEEKQEQEAPEDEGEGEHVPEVQDGDGVHFGRWEDDEHGRWIPEEREEMVKELELDSEDEEDREEEKEEDASKGLMSHPLSQLRVLSLRGNPIEKLVEINRLRYLRGLVAVDIRDTPIVEELGEEESITEVQIRLGGHRGQRIRVPSQRGYMGLPEGAAILHRVNGKEITSEDVDNARQERAKRVKTFREQWLQREKDRAEAERQKREQEAAGEEEGGGEDEDED